jgi:hypothetical protein
VVGEAHRSGGDRRRGVLAAEGGLLGHLQQAARRGRLRSAGNGRCSAERLRSPSSTEVTGERETLSREVLGMVWFFSGKKEGFL